MRKILLFSFFLSFGIIQQVNSQGIITGIAGGAIVKNLIKTASNQVAQLMGVATRNSDYLLEKNLSRLNIMIANLSYSLSKDLDKRFDQIDIAEQQAIYDLNRLSNEVIKNSSAKVLETSEFLIMDLNDLLNRIPFLKDKDYISSIDGLGQKFRNNGTYKIICKGTVFKIENRDSIFINGKLLKSDYITKDKNNVLSFEVPASLINSYFRVYDVNRINLSIKSYKEKELIWYKPSTWFSKDLTLVSKYNGKLLLLPKVPIKSYTLLQSTRENRYSEETYEVTGHLLLMRSPIKNQWTYANVEATIPPGCLMIKGSEEVRGENVGWISITKPYTYDDANNKVIAKCGSQWYDAERNFWITCKYRKPVSYTKDTNVFLQHLGVNVTGGLFYGTYIYKLPSNYGFFVLELKFFNGEVITFTPYEQSKNGVMAEIKNAGIDAKNLVVKIDPV